MYVRKLQNTQSCLNSNKLYLIHNFQEHKNALKMASRSRKFGCLGAVILAGNSQISWAGTQHHMSRERPKNYLSKLIKDLGR